MVDSDRQYWDERVSRHGAAAPGYIDELQNSYESQIVWNAIQHLARPRPGLSVLDVGCGTGRIATRMGTLGCDVTAIDFLPRMIALATPHPNVRYEVGAASSAALTSREYDVVLSVTVLQHITDPDEFARTLANIRRVLKPGGAAVVLEYAPTMLNCRGQPGGYLQVRTHQQWCAEFGAAGFEVLGQRGVRFVDARVYRRARDLLAAAMPGRFRRAQALGLGVVLGACRGIDLAAGAVPACVRWSDVRGYRLGRGD